MLGLGGLASTREIEGGEKGEEERTDALHKTRGLMGLARYRITVCVDWKICLTCLEKAPSLLAIHVIVAGTISIKDLKMTRFLTLLHYYSYVHFLIWLQTCSPALMGLLATATASLFQFTRMTLGSQEWFMFARVG